MEAQWSLPTKRTGQHRVIRIRLGLRFWHAPPGFALISGEWVGGALAAGGGCQPLVDATPHGYIINRRRTSLCGVIQYRNRRITMPADVNPYSAPSPIESNVFPWLGQRFPGRSVIAFAFAVLEAFTALLTGGLWAINAIDLGRFGALFLLSLVVSSAMLLCSARCYATGSRGFAVLLAVLSLCVMTCGVLLCLHDAGVIPPF
ncbi:hypothetical protein Mal15_16870 [Stieleria maiorica]|uniref:Uncharacterized protein n=1 Tax=Stieleria maiorica TaxID=2795974 RepID=A0A5B9MBS7_9BACT|nr:hypothetical protein [Stieleria maiorica]QEF97646.1 hypothetical protein Mal15_16870 [Stieleria maiorica]